MAEVPDEMLLALESAEITLCELVLRTMMAADPEKVFGIILNIFLEQRYDADDAGRTSVYEYSGKQADIVIEHLTPMVKLLNQHGRFMDFIKSKNSN